MPAPPWYNFGRVHRGVITRALAGTARGFGRASRVFLYLAIGTERMAGFREGAALMWGDWSSHGHDGSLFPVERELFERFIPPRSRVLVIGCGGGRDLLALEALGHTMTGVEPSAAALEMCATALHGRGRTATLVRGFFEDARVSGPFDAIVFSYFCYSYIPESARRIACLRKAAELLAPGGRVFISYVVIGGPHPMLPRLARLSAALTGCDWRVEAGDAVSLRREGMPRPCFFLEHVFTEVEILEEIAAAGMETVHHRTTADYPWIICAAS
jgi:SAM-dependent methyltransferase